MANSKQSDKVGSKKKETGSVAFVDRTDLHLPGSHQLQSSSMPKPITGSDSRRAAVSKRTGQSAAKAKDRHQSRRPAGVIYIKERYFTMLKKDLILRNPLRVMGYENDDILKIWRCAGPCRGWQNGFFGSAVVERPAQGQKRSSHQP
jgi:hypothetical protein